MTKSKRPAPRRNKPARIALAVGLAVATGLMLLPADSAERLKDPLVAALRPGQSLARAAVEGSRESLGRLRALWDDEGQAGQLQRELDTASERNRRLEAALLAALAKRPDGDGDFHVAAKPSEPLLLAHWVEARVLGRQARAYLGERALLDVGENAGISSGALVVDEPAGVIDVGRDAHIEEGRLVRAGRYVWGQVRTVGRHTSSVQPLSAEGYRDTVQLASVSEGRLRFAARGVLVGTGGRLCEIRLVAADEPVVVGDLVFAAAADGVLDAPLLYGTVVRAERPPGAAHWRIWMQPAADPARARRVAVLRTEVNPRRLAGTLRNKH